MVKKIALCLLATRKYDQFVQPLIEDVKKYFLPNHKIEVNLFVDKIGEYEGDERVSVVQHIIESYKFPYITLFRYKIMASVKYDADYIFYMDVDMGIVDTVGDEVLGDIVAVRHPGFFNGGGSWGDNEKSTSYTPVKNRVYYYAGGFQGGSRDKYYALMETLRDKIEEDESNGVLAEWHDETHFNRAISEMDGVKVLSPAYCMVEQQNLRELWGIAHISPKILALAKNHEEIRN